MKLLLTSAGISNNSILNALVDLLGKPIEASKAVFIPTAIYGIIGGGISVCLLFTLENMRLILLYDSCPFLTPLVFCLAFVLKLHQQTPL